MGYITNGTLSFQCCTNVRNCTGDILENLYSKVPPDSTPQFNERKTVEGEGTGVRIQNSFVGRLLLSARDSAVMWSTINGGLHISYRRQNAMFCAFSIITRKVSLEIFELCYFQNCTMWWTHSWVTHRQSRGSSVIKVKGYWQDDRCSTTAKIDTTPFRATTKEALSPIHFSKQQKQKILLPRKLIASVKFAFMLPFIVIEFFLNKQPVALIFQIYSFIKLYMFQASSLPIIRSFLLYILLEFHPDSTWKRSSKTCMKLKSAESTVENSMMIGREDARNM